MSLFLRLRHYSTALPRGADHPHYRLKAALMATYLVGAFTLPFVPPLLESRAARRDGRDVTRRPISFVARPCF